MCVKYSQKLHLISKKIPKKLQSITNSTWIRNVKSRYQFGFLSTKNSWNWLFLGAHWEKQSPSKISSSVPSSLDLLHLRTDIKFEQIWAQICSIPQASKLNANCQRSSGHPRGGQNYNLSSNLSTNAKFPTFEIQDLFLGFFFSPGTNHGFLNKMLPSSSRLYALTGKTYSPFGVLYVSRRSKRPQQDGFKVWKCQIM